MKGKTTNSYRRLGVLLIGALGVLLITPQGAAREPCREGPQCWALFALERGLKLALYRTHDLHKPAPGIRRGVVLIHGYQRNAHRYFPRMTKAAEQAGVAEETLVIAPGFSIRQDDRPHRRPGELYWKRNKNWRRGDKSIEGPKGRMSSFKSVEILLAHLGQKGLFPNLKKITVVGHSAGGQFVQRFALGHAPVKSLADVRVRYVVANPGSYLYLNRQRPGPGFDGGFAVPTEAAGCPAYNRYEYGLDDLNGYMSAAGPEKILERARQRELVLLLGTADDDPGHAALPRKCGAGLQGRHRLERGRLFKAHLDRFFAPHNTRVVLVPGVAHRSREMFLSEEGRAAIFF